MAPPKTLWAQRANKVFLTIELADCLKPLITLDSDKLTFKGKSDSIQTSADHEEHQVTIEFYEPINVSESKFETKERGTEFILIKEKPNWWPRLLKDKTKQHWLKMDFPKWKDEDETDEEAEQGLGGMSGMPGMPGMGGENPDFSEFMRQMQMQGGMPDLGDDEENGDSNDGDSDDAEDGDEIPELS